MYHICAVKSIVNGNLRKDFLSTDSQRRFVCRCFAGVTAARACHAVSQRKLTRRGRVSFLPFPCDKTVAVENPEILRQSLIQRVRFFAEVFVNRLAKLGKRGLAVDERPDKAAEAVEVDIAEFRAEKQLLNEPVDQPVFSIFSTTKPSASVSQPTDGARTGTRSR